MVLDKLTTAGGDALGVSRTTPCQGFSGALTYLLGFMYKRYESYLGIGMPSLVLCTTAQRVCSFGSRKHHSQNIKYKQDTVFLAFLINISSISLVMSSSSAA